MRRQYGVIPYVKEQETVRLVLVTGKLTGFWIFPKGNPIRGRSDVEVAVQEAFEEAGIEGDIDSTSAYRTRILTKRGEAELILFPMTVARIHGDWPEKRERKRCIVSLEEADRLLKEGPLWVCKKAWETDIFKKR